MSKFKAMPGQDDGGLPAPREDTVPANIGANLRRIRKQQGHSLDTLARLSLVSRAMLGQIETGKSVPTITLVLRIANALGVSVSALIAEPKRTRAVVLGRTSARLITSSGGRFSMRMLASPEIALAAEVYDIAIAPVHREPVDAYPPGTRASLTVTSGIIEVQIGDGETLRIGEGDAILFEADAAQTYFNPSDVPSTGYLVFVPARKSAL